LEKQNADLVDKNASLEEEYRKVSAFKPLMESYKNQIAELETKTSSRIQEIDSLKFELDQTRTKLKIAIEERTKDSETLELYQERVRELEFTKPAPSKRARTTSGVDGDDFAELSEGLGGELDDALSGTTTTDLKLQIRKLKRELEAVRKNEADASRVLVLENLLEDANRMKARYESDYLTAHREKLVLQRDLEEIRSGKSLGDGYVSNVTSQESRTKHVHFSAEAAIALRQRLNETVEQLEALRKDHTELEVKIEGQSNELTIAKSDPECLSISTHYASQCFLSVNLVNKDQLDILATLRESVNEDKAGLEADVERLKDHLKELNDKNRMQLEQVNALLLEKVNLQSQGIGQRELALQRERDFGYALATSSNIQFLMRDLPGICVLLYLGRVARRFLKTSSHGSLQFTKRTLT
jgi:protein HOOK3